MQKACAWKEILLQVIQVLGKAALGHCRSGSLTIREEKLPDTQVFITKHEKLTSILKQLQKNNLPFKQAQLSFPFQIQVECQVGVPQTEQHSSTHGHSGAFATLPNFYSAPQDFLHSGFQCLLNWIVCLFSFLLNNSLQGCKYVELYTGQITDESTQREALFQQAQVTGLCFDIHGSCSFIIIFHFILFYPVLDVLII